jgi:PAS domain S-box-containing protein
MDLDPARSCASAGASAASDRLDALHRYDILDTPPEDAFDRITRLATTLFDAPMALVNLVAEDRQWFKSAVGLERRETELDASLCVHALASDDVTVIEDATQDERVANNPLVTGPPAIRFYAGAPLITPDGFRIGTLCVMDTEPRRFSDATYAQLDDLASMVMDELELRHEIQVRTAAQEKVQHQKERYRSALSTSPVIFARVGPDLRYEWVFDAHANGTADELVGRRDDEIDQGPGVAALMNLKRRTFETNEQQREEITFTCSDGPRTYDVTATPRRDGPSPQAVITAALDVTERKTMERRLRRLTDEYQTVFENVQDALFYIDVTPTEDDFRFTVAQVNASHEALTGLDSEAVRGKTPHDLLDSEAADEVVANYRRCAEQRRRIEYEEELSFPNGTKTWHTKLSPVIVDGEVAHIVGIARDVTERKETERALRRSRERLARAHEIARLGSWEHDLRTGTLYVSEQARDIFGWAETQPITHTTFMEAVHPDDRDTIPEHRDPPLVPGDEIDVQYRIRRPDGTQRIVHERGEAQFDDAGTLVRLSGTVQDVTDRERRKKELQDTNRRLRMALDAADAGTFRYDVESNTTHWDDRMQAIYGLHDDEVPQTKEAFWQRVHPEDRDAAREKLAEVLKHDDRFEARYRILRSDGEVRHVQSQGLVVRDDDGTPTATVGVQRDVTERKRAADELRRSEERFRSLAEQTSDIISRHAADGTFLYVSPSVERILGYNPDALVGADPYPIIHPDDRERVRSAHLDLLDGTPMRIEFRHLHAEGHAVWVESIGDLVPTRDGAPEAVLSTRPIHERKQAEAELRKSRKRWQQLVENQRDAIQISVDGVIQYVNASGVDLLGADTADEIIGRPLNDFLTAEQTKADMAERVEQIRRGVPTTPYEHEVERLDGERRIVESYSVPIEYKGERAAQTIVRDLTERKQTQKQLQQAQKMETVGALAGGIAHDFNNILHSVTAYVQMVQDSLDVDHPDRVLLERAAGGLERAGDLVQKLLTFSRQDPIGQPERVRVGAIVRESIDLVRPSLPKGVQIRTDINDEGTIQGDPGQLHQVAMNIMTNAGQAMGAAGPGAEHVLDVDVSTIDVDDDLARRHLNLEPGRYVRLSISDTGPGMDDDTQERIFEPFFTTKEVGSGTGLGLSVVHGIVQSHDGAVAVYSEPDEGTTFNVYLPYATEDAPRPDAPTPSDTTADANGRHILFVDDDPQIVELEAVRLRRLGFAVTPCRTAPEALQAFDAAATPFDLVVTDYAMPEMNGLDLSRELRERGYRRPILVMSGFSAQVSPDAMRAAGVTSFLRKPVGSDELQRTLMHVLDAEDAA